MNDIIVQIRSALENSQPSASLISDAIANVGEDAVLVGSKPLQAAAVLFGLIEVGEGSHSQLLLTERAMSLRSHAGEMSFPGGRVDESDGSFMVTALREAHEEIGLPPSNAEVIGYLEPRLTLTGFAIQPVVAMVKPPARWVLEKQEVASLHRVSLDEAMDVHNYVSSSIDVGGQQRQFYQVELGGKRVWGATAGIIHSLASRL